MSDTHEFLAFSFAPVWGHCAGAPLLASQFPQEETDETREGTASHWVASTIIKADMQGKSLPYEVYKAEAPNGVVLDDDMRDGAYMFVSDIRSTRAKYPDSISKMLCEQKLMGTHLAPRDCGGTADAACYFPEYRRIVVWEYKYGHKEVNEFENLQLIANYSAIAGHLGIDDLIEKNLLVEFRIVQPRAYVPRGPVRGWTIPAIDLRRYIDQLKFQAAKALLPDPETISGSHCFYCQARSHCAASRNASMACVEHSGRAVAEVLPPEALAFEMDLLERAVEACKGRLEGHIAQAEAYIRGGTIVPGYGLENGKGRRKWTQPPEVLRSLGEAYKLPIEKPDVFITPTQFKTMGAIDDSVINAYSEVPITGLKLVKQNTDAIRRILQGIKN